MALTPSDHESHLGLAASLGSLGRATEQAAAYRTALGLRPNDVASWINLGVALSAGPDTPETEAATEAAFRSGVEAAARAGAPDARAPLNLGRYLAKLSRPAEALRHFRAASAAADAEHAAEATLGAGTSLAQQGRLREAVAAFRAASAERPRDAALSASIGQMEAQAAEVEAARAAADAVPDLCGSPCQEVVDGAGITVCEITWATGCGDGAPPPAGFGAASTVAELCPRACAFYLHQRRQRQRQQQMEAPSEAA